MTYRQFMSGKHLNHNHFSNKFQTLNTRTFLTRKKVNNSDCMESSKRTFYPNTAHQLFSNQRYPNRNRLRPGTQQKYAPNSKILFGETNGFDSQDFQLKSNQLNQPIILALSQPKQYMKAAKSDRFHYSQKTQWRNLKETSSTDSREAESINFDKFNQINSSHELEANNQVIGNKTAKTQKKSSFQAHIEKRISEHKKNLLLLKNFRIIEKIGQGKSGKVFKCTDKVTGAIMAMKVINKESIKKTNMLQQLIRELKIQAILNHPNIAKLYGFFHDRQNFYILTQLGCDGQLYNLMKGQQRMNQQIVSYVINSLLRALDYMHSRKILHRDVKPQNVVMVHGCVKLCDFGWAVSNDTDLRSTICGTPLYLSPELISEGQYDEKVDIWAVGILAFEMATGKTPFNITNRAQLSKIVTSDIQFPENLTLSNDFKKFVREILHKDPKKRLSCKQLKKLTFIRKYQELQIYDEISR